MDQKKHLIAGVSAFALTFAVGMIAGTALIDKAELPQIEKAEKAIIAATEKVETAAKKVEAAAEKVEQAAEAKVEQAKEAVEAVAEKVEHAVKAEDKAEDKAEAKEAEAVKAETPKVEAKAEVKDAPAPAPAAKAEAPKAEAKAEEKEAPAPAEKAEAPKAEAPKAEAKAEVKEAPAKEAETTVEKVAAVAEKVEHAAEAKVEKAEEAVKAVAEKVEHAIKGEDDDKHEAPKAEHKTEAKDAHAAPAEKDAHAVPAKAKTHAVHWGYTGHEGPEHWGDLAKEFAMCKAGAKQSPIDIAPATAASDIKLTTLYKPVELEILNNGHTVQFNVDNGSKLVAYGKTYQLKQVHFHTPSEHVVETKPYPMEAHFVHQAEDGKLAVLGVFFEVGRKNQALKAIVDNTPMLPAAAAAKGVQIEPAKLLPQNKNLVRYSGSLTTPPCSEGVLWHVFAEPQHASLAQIAKLHKAMGDNVRPAQPLNDRKLGKSAK